MKKLLIVLFLLTSFGLQAQMKNALNAGNSLEASKYAASLIEVTWLGAETESVSSLSFINKLKGLFETCDQTSFRILHSGQADMGTQYIMGDFICGEKEYSVTYYFETQNSIDLVQQFIIEDK